jgi:type I pantothenate kinase
LNADPDAIEQLAARLATTLGAKATPSPPGSQTRLVGITGSVAAGKSTLAAALREPLSRALAAPVTVVGSDGFLYADDVLRERGAFDKKGFPESHDRAAILHFVAELEAGAQSIEVPVYSHASRSADARLTVALPCTLIIEGVYAFEVLRASTLPHVGVYLDASEEDLEQFFLTRWSHLLAERGEYVRAAWRDVNLPNLRLHIEKERARADLVLHKAADHQLTLSGSGPRGSRT